MNKANAIQALVELLNQPSSTDLLKEYASGALFAIVQDNSNNKKVLTTAKGVEALIPLVKADAENLKSNAAKALWAACDGNSTFCFLQRLTAVQQRIRS